MDEFFREDPYPAADYVDGCTYVHKLSKKDKQFALSHPFQCSEEQVHFGDIQLQGLQDEDLVCSKRKAEDPVYRTNEDEPEPLQKKKRPTRVEL